MKKIKGTLIRRQDRAVATTSLRHDLNSNHQHDDTTNQPGSSSTSEKPIESLLKSSSEVLGISLNNKRWIEGVCKRCNAVPWERLRDRLSEKVPPNLERVLELQDPDCRLCRFFVRFIYMHEDLDAPYSLRVLEGDYQDTFPHIIDPRLSQRYVGCLTLEGHMPPSQPLIVVSELFTKEKDANAIFEDFFPEEVDFEKARRLIYDCNERHGGCRLESEVNLDNLKLIDCEKRAIVGAFAETPDFVALSYVWGPRSFEATNHDLNCWQEVPKTIRDSMTATETLGFKYLWVDRYVRRHAQIDNVIAQKMLTVTVY